MELAAAAVSPGLLCWFFPAETFVKDSTLENPGDEEGKGALKASGVGVCSQHEKAMEITEWFGLGETLRVMQCNPFHQRALLQIPARIPWGTCRDAQLSWTHLGSPPQPGLPQCSSAPLGWVFGGQQELGWLLGSCLQCCWLWLLWGHRGCAQGLIQHRPGLGMGQPLGQSRGLGGN